MAKKFIPAKPAIPTTTKLQVSTPDLTKNTDLFSAPYVLQVQDKNPYKLIKPAKEKDKIVDFNDEEFEDFKKFLALGTIEDIEFGKNQVAELFRSNWYRDNLKRKYPSITDYQIEHIVNTQIQNMLPTKGYSFDFDNDLRGIFDPGTKAFHWAYRYNSNTPKSIIGIPKGMPYVPKQTMIQHELLHSANPYKLLPLRINNDDINMIPRKDVDLVKNKELYDETIARPDELRVRLLRLNQIAHMNNFPLEELLKEYRRLYTVNKKLIPIDLRSLLFFFDDNQILNAAKKVVTLAAPIGVASSFFSGQTDKNEDQLK